MSPLVRVKTGRNLWNARSWEQAYNWACEQFGSNHFVAAGSDWVFDKEEDAMLFILKWGS